MTPDRADGAGLTAALLSVLLWQAGLIVQKLLVADTNSGSLMLIQVGVAAALMWCALWATGRLPPPGRKTLLNVAWGVMAPGLVFGLGIAGAARSDGVSIAVLWGLLPLLGPVLARVVLREPLHWTFPLGGLLALGGLALMLSNRAATGEGDWIGNLLVFASVCCASLSSVIARFINRGRDAWFPAATLQLTGASLTGIAIVLAWGWHPPHFDSGATLLSLSYLILGMTLLNYVAFNFALSRLAVSWVGLSAATAPVVGLCMAWLFLGSVITKIDVAAAAIILLGVALPHLRRVGSGSA